MILTNLARFWLQAFVAAACGGINPPIRHVFPYFLVTVFVAGASDLSMR